MAKRNYFSSAKRIKETQISKTQLEFKRDALKIRMLNKHYGSPEWKILETEIRKLEWELRFSQTRNE